MTVTGPGIRTIDELLEAAQIDLEEWEIIPPVTLNAWGTGDAQSHQVKVRLRRKVTETVSSGINLLLEKLRQEAVPRPYPQHSGRSDAKHLVFGISDLHIAKLCWSPETGYENYDLDIAKRVFENAVDDILASVMHLPIDSATLIIGSDMFHSDDDRNRTYGGTPLDCDGRHAKVFAEVCDLVAKQIERLSNLFPVYCPLIPGNHDATVSLYAAHVLKAWFHNTPGVEIDNRPVMRKYKQFGKCLLGFTHGHDIKLDSLPLVMATEAPEMWAQSPCRDWFIGHYHRSKETKYLTLDEQTGVRLRVLPALCPPDKWHSDRLFVGTRRAAEGHVYDREQGYVLTTSVNARDD